MKKYEWAIVGSGIAGIAISEILTREGHSCVLIEKNKSLASETTREFHEWLHVGSLFTLIPDRLVTLKYILGAIDDLMEYYGSFPGMNLRPSECGLDLEDTNNAWFNSNYIHFKYRIKNRKITLPWLYGVARSIFLIEKIHKHDWLRRRAGEISPFKIGKLKRIATIIIKLLRSSNVFEEIKTPDMTINSRNLLRDMIATAIQNGLDIIVDNQIVNIKKDGDFQRLIGKNYEVRAKNIALCNGKGIEDFHNTNIKTSYAPIAIVKGLPSKAKSFVELDYFPKNCINQLTKGNGIGQVGGITFSNKDKCDKYLDYVVKMHKKYEPNIQEIYRYNGIKSEITFKNQPRGYLYQIVNLRKGLWGIIPGKFTLAFSMAPEFYRTIYKKNPKKYFKTKKFVKGKNYQISDTVWSDKSNNVKEI